VLLPLPTAMEPGSHTLDLSGILGECEGLSPPLAPGGWRLLDESTLGRRLLSPRLPQPTGSGLPQRGHGRCLLVPVAPRALKSDQAPLLQAGADEWPEHDTPSVRQMIFVRVREERCARN